MNYGKFKKLPEQSPEKPKVGDIFLEGDEMIKQKIDKEKGDTICYFTVISVNKNRIEYSIQYDKLT